MRTAFSAIVRKAYMAAADAETLPPEYMAQQRELDSLMSLMNSEFGRCGRAALLRRCAARRRPAALLPPCPCVTAAPAAATPLRAPAPRSQRRSAGLAAAQPRVPLSRWRRLLKYYALRHAREALSPTEEVDKARLTQLTFEGLTLELTTVEYAGDEAEGRLKRTVWATSVLFAAPCSCAEEVEERLIVMFEEPAGEAERAVV
jgi:hypothetical protein